MSLEKLKKYDNLYYNSGMSPISDAEYDRLKEKVRDADSDNPYFSNVGFSVSGEKVELPYVLGSLDKLKMDTVEKWISEHGNIYILSEKMDGVSFTAHYNNGKVVWAATRGNGFVGKDITNKAKLFCKDIPCLLDVHVRGEGMLINGTHEKLGFKTARNGVAGILNSKAKLLDLSKHIVPFFYEVIDINGMDQFTEMDRVDFLRNHFDYTPKTRYLSTKKGNVLEEIQKFYKEIKETSPYEVDGVVITTADYVRENVPYPKNKVAYKENAKGIESIVIKVEWNVSRTGRIVPIVHIEPINTQGVTISKATGFNAKFILDNMITKESKVLIERAGDCIPHIVV